MKLYRYMEGLQRMAKIFNINGACSYGRHYMVNLQPRLEEIRAMIDAGQYFAINRARQYGKTTTLKALAAFLEKDYVVASLDFQKIETDEFSSGSSFVRALAREICWKIRRMQGIPDEVFKWMQRLSAESPEPARMAELSACFSLWCEQSEKPVVLTIDEADKAADNQVFLDFLAQIRAAYMDSEQIPAFQSVILAGVYDVRSMKRKIRPDEEHKENSPWNIAARFRVDMGFSAKDIAGMLKEYEADFHTGMKIEEMAEQIYQYTSGYPYLVSWLCKCMDEDIAQNKGDKQRAWTREGLLEAVKMLLQDQNPLFESLIGRLHDFPELGSVISRLLFQGQGIAYNPDDRAVQNAKMFGFVKEEDGSVVIANRIFETRLYNSFLLKLKEQNSHMYEEGFRQKNQFIADGHLNMRLVLEKFAETFHDLYGGCSEAFLEDEGRKYFMLFLRPVINGIGSCYVEPQTRNRERMDLVIDYRGEQSVVELKIWRGNAYHERGEVQLAGYLDSLHLKKGYLLCFCFSKKKERGLKEVLIGDKLIVEAIV